MNTDLMFISNIIPAGLSIFLFLITIPAILRDTSIWYAVVSTTALASSISWGLRAMYCSLVWPDHGLVFTVVPLILMVILAGQSTVFLCLAANRRECGR